MLALVSIFGFLFHSQANHFVPEIQFYGSASEGGYAFMKEELDRRLPYISYDTNRAPSPTSSSGGFEWTTTAGGSFVHELNDKWEIKVGAHLGYAKASIEGGIKGDDGNLSHGQKVLLDYWRGDLQLGLRYWCWAHVGFQGAMNLERGIAGTYTWKYIDDGYIIEKGDIGEDGQSQIFFPTKYFLKVGPAFRLFDHLEIAPWVGFGKAPIVTNDSRVYNKITGKSYPLDETEGFAKGKFGIDLGYAL